ncbi:MAG: DinB family protein [Pyrinomonadaceae bacterium]|nr:DinB family protein [Phycisphaerales bacterium]
MIAGTSPIAQGMLQEFERELVTTRTFLKRLPEGKLAWRPHPKSMSAGQLAYHIAETPGMSLRFALLERGPAPNFALREEAATQSELLGLLDASAAYVRDTLPTVGDARMQEMFAIDLPDGSVLELGRGRFLRSVMLNHWYHHRGQLGVYLRLLEVPVPSSYGPSGDEQAGGL